MRLLLATCENFIEVYMCLFVLEALQKLLDHFETVHI